MQLQLQQIRDQTVEFVLSELEPVIFDPAPVRIEPPIFKQLLEEFDFRARAAREVTGGAFQAMVFAFIGDKLPYTAVEHNSRI